MTGEDRNADALTAALRSPALPAEQVGEAAAVSVLLEALPATAPGRGGVLRSRRGVAVAAVTIASLGVGGLAAAGPGLFQPAADAPQAPVPTEPRTNVTAPGSIDEEDDGVGETATTRGVADAVTGTNSETTEGSDDDSSPVDDGECAEGNHGKTVSSIAQATESGPGKGQTVSEAAHSDCGKTDDTATDDDEISDTDGADDSSPTGDVECAEGNHGKTVSSIAQATESGPGKGQTVSEAAQSDCGKTDDTATDAGDDADDNDDDADDGDDSGKPDAPGKPDRPDQPDKPGKP